jgi:hypothetical protein
MPSRRSANPSSRSRRDYHEPVTDQRATVPPEAALPPFIVVDDEPLGTAQADPAALVLTCANCGERMDERKCKLICRCGYFASCSDYY